MPPLSGSAWRFMLAALLLVAWIGADAWRAVAALHRGHRYGRVVAERLHRHLGRLHADRSRAARRHRRAHRDRDEHGLRHGAAVDRGAGRRWHGGRDRQSRRAVGHSLGVDGLPGRRLHGAGLRVVLQRRGRHRLPARRQVTSAWCRCSAWPARCSFSASHSTARCSSAARSRWPGWC